MKTNLLFSLCMVISVAGLRAQGVTQLNNNNSLEVTVPLAPGRIIVISDIDSSIWVTDATTAAGTVQISPNIKYELYGGVLGNKFIFSGSTPATGSEVYITDGTAAGTVLVKDIFPGATGSFPDDGPAMLGGFFYFTAQTPAEGRELWRTNGTLAGTTLVKDVLPGAAGSNEADEYQLISTGTYLLFAAQNAALGIELWKSDGTNAGTIPLKDINPNAPSSDPQLFLPYNNIVLFLATTAANGQEIWKTDGTTGGTVLVKDIYPGADSSEARAFFPFNNIILFLATDNVAGDEIWKTDGTTGGTVLVKDINPGIASSTSFNFMGFPFPIFLGGFHVFNNRAYFRATDGISTGQVWGTDGTTGNTTLLKDIIAGTSPEAFILLFNAQNLINKFIFPVSDGEDRAEIWESDGTPAGTKLLKAFASNDPPEYPIIFRNFSFDFGTGIFTFPLFQGNKVFFGAPTLTEGFELWITDGTVAGTTLVKDINPGVGNGIDFGSGSYLYTANEIFFVANDGTTGTELWKSNGTAPGTTQVANINPGAGSSNPQLYQFISFGKIIFTATDGDHPDFRDLYVVEGTFQAPLPVTLDNFTVKLKGKDALLQWSTLQEVNSKDFTIQRSYDGRKFEDIGVVQALGNSSSKNDYSYTDVGIANSGKSIVYYSLLASDKDGKSKNSNVISLKLNSHSEWNVRLLSNPVRDNINIMLSGITENVQLSIRDLNGKAFYKNSLQNVNGLINVPASKLQSGIYILVAETKNERKIVRFVK